MKNETSLANEAILNVIQHLSVDELTNLKLQIDVILLEKSENKFEEIWLSSNQYKGSGKCWAAKVDKNGKIESFLDAEVTEKDGYKAKKLFKVPLVEGARYKFVEEGSKSSDDKFFSIVFNGVLIKD